MIAEQAGTSIGTVDRAINNREGISPHRREEILAVAQGLGYRPNQFASALSRNRTLKIGVVYPKEPREFYRDIDLGLAKAAEELADFGVQMEPIRCKASDRTSLCQKLDSIDPKAYSGLIINTVGADIAKRIDHFAQQGVPVITFNSDVPESSRLFFVGHDFRQSGALGAELLGIMLHGQGNVAVMGHSAFVTPFTERFAGFSDYMQATCPGIHVFACSDPLGTPKSATQSLRDLLRIIPDIAGVFCTGYSATVHAIAALQQLGRHDLLLMGYDVTSKTADAMRQGFCSALLYQNPYQQGYQALRLMSRHLMEGWLPAKQHLYVDTRIVLQSNLESYTTGQHPDVML